VTGAHSDWRELLKMLDALAPGDVVTVTRIDQLARQVMPVDKTKKFIAMEPVGGCVLSQAL
jgi:DNA invertase Pin-like site-specific DNA recombinase